MQKLDRLTCLLQLRNFFNLIGENFMRSSIWENILKLFENEK